MSMLAIVKYILIYENRASKMKLYGVKKFFSRILIAEMGVKMNLRIITKNHQADPEIGFLTKLISKPYGRATAMPPAWELRGELLYSFVSYSRL